MIFVILALIGVVGVVATSWRALTGTERWWTVLIWCDVVGMFSIPTTAATSTWRPIADRAIWIGAGVGALLMICGAGLALKRHAEGRPLRQLLPGMVIGALPLLVIGLSSLLWRA